MKKSTATSSVTDTIIRISGLALMTLAFMVMTATVAKGEQPAEKPQYAEWVVSFNDAVQQSKKDGPTDHAGLFGKRLVQLVHETCR